MKDLFVENAQNNVVLFQGYQASVTTFYDVILSMSLRVSWDWQRSAFEEVGWRVSGEISNSFQQNLDTTQAISRNGRLGNIRNKVLKA